MRANGTDRPARPLAEVREEYRRERLELRLAEARNQRKLLESWYGLGPSLTGGWGEFVDPADRLRDGDRLLQPLGSQLERREQGHSWLVRNEQELAFIRGLGRWLVAINDNAFGAIETLVDFVVGEGMTFRATTKDNAAGKLVAAVQDCVDRFIDLNEFDELQQELVRRAPRDGEYGLRIFPKSEGDTLLRIIEPEYITAAGAGAEEDSFGVLTDPEDVETLEGLRVQYRLGDPPEDLSPEEFQFVKINTDRTIKRGLSDFFACGEGLEGARKLLRNLREGAAIQAAIAGIRQHDLAGRDQAGALQDDLKTRLRRTDPVTGREVKYQKYEPGMIMDIPKGLTYVPPPWMNTGAPNHLAIYQAALRSAAVRWGMPEFMLSADSSNNNYASILVAGSPFVRRVKRLQKFYKRRFLDLVWRAVRNAAEGGHLLGYSVEEVVALIEIQCEAPTPEIAHELENAQVDHADMDRGVLSVQTRRQRRGLDDEQETKNLKDRPMPQAPGQFQDFDDEGNPVEPRPPQGPGGAGGGFFPARESRTRRKYRRLREQYGERIAEGIAKAARQLLECGGEGGKPGPCPRGGRKRPPPKGRPRLSDDPGVRKATKKLTAAKAKVEQARARLATSREGLVTAKKDLAAAKAKVKQQGPAAKAAVAAAKEKKPRTPRAAKAATGGEWAGHPLAGKSRAEQDQWLLQHDVHLKASNDGRLASYRTGLRNVRTPDDEAVAAEAVAAVNQHRGMGSLTVKDLYTRAKEKRPRLTVRQFQASLARAEERGELDFGPYTQSVASMPDPEFAIPFGDGPGVFVRPGDGQPIAKSTRYGI